MSSVNKILESNSKSPKDPKETRALATQMHDSLVHEGTVVQASGPPAVPAKRGRPRGSTSTSKSPSRARSASGGSVADFGEQMPIPPPAGAAKAKPADDPETVANRMKCRRLIRKLRAYKRNFPSLLKEDLDSVNPHLCSYEQLTALIDSCKEVIGDEIESMTSPDIVGSLLDGLETAAIKVAADSEDGSVTKKLLHLRHFSQVAKSDPCIAMDLRLIACEMTGWIPQSPYVRLALNLVKCAAKMIKEGTTAEMFDEAVNSDKFSEF